MGNNCSSCGELSKEFLIEYIHDPNSNNTSYVQMTETSEANYTVLSTCGSKRPRPLSPQLPMGIDAEENQAQAIRDLFESIQTQLSTGPPQREIDVKLSEIAERAKK